MTKRRVLAIWLDGYETTLGDRLMDEGELPALARLRDNSLRALLDHGPAQRTGLAGEHFSTGLSPEAAQKWAAVSFDPATYEATQEGTDLVPFPDALGSRTVVFDMPYFDLRKAPEVEGLVNWGAHDPGVATDASPDELLAEFFRRFGTYPAGEFIYGQPWSSAEKSRRMGAALADAVNVRTRATRWLLEERFPAWDLALVAVSEPHSAIEGLWHGVDPAHPLHDLPSAGPAGDGLRSVYRAVDDLVAEMVDAFPDATVMVCSMGGMGPNLSDVASMALLPELLYRDTFGEALLETRSDWASAAAGQPMLGPAESWSRSILDQLPSDGSRPPDRRSARDAISARVPTAIQPALRRIKRAIPRRTQVPERTSGPLRLSLGWMPAAHYQPFWHEMAAFALPSFYDGRIRINLVGRERDGIVDPSDYATACDALEQLLSECRDPATGEGVVDFIERPAGDRDPLTMGPTESDLVIVWKGPLAIEHPRIGLIGPLPPRRSGGHTGPHGMLYLHGPDIAAGDRGERSAFDVVPTLIELLDEPIPSGLSGTSIAP